MDARYFKNYYHFSKGYAVAFSKDFGLKFRIMQSEDTKKILLMNFKQIDVDIM